MDKKLYTDLTFLSVTAFNMTLLEAAKEKLKFFNKTTPDTSLVGPEWK